MNIKKLIDSYFDNISHFNNFYANKINLVYYNDYFKYLEDFKKTIGLIYINSIMIKLL